MSENWDIQTPGETRDWEMDWSDVLTETGEEIFTSSWSITPDAGPDTGAGLSLESFDTNGLISHVLVTGLTLGTSYQLKNEIVTTTGQVLQREITIRCANR